MKSFIKPAILGGLILVLMIPLSMIEGVIRERNWNRDQVVNDIAASWTRAQNISGPWLVVDYQVTTEHREWDKEKELYVTKPVVSHRHLLLRPLTSDITGTLEVSHRYRGIFQVPVYTADVSIEAAFNLAPLRSALKDEQGEVKIKSANVEFGVTDARGFVASPVLTWDGTAIESRPGTAGVTTGNGFHAPLAVDGLAAQGEIKLNTEFQLRGIESLQVVPAGYDSQVAMTSAWPHPSFIGGFLPAERTIDDNGFQAFWAVSAFAAGASLAPEIQCCGGNFTTPGKILPMGVRLYEPLDLYQLNERASKYGALFLVVTFAVFWLTELFHRLSLHPVQYGLVGLALAIFFLLLLSLSEHIGFGTAYLIATIACIVLISTYIRPLTGNRPALLLSGFLTLLYGACYLILMLESYALLVGSILMFALLAAVMLLTRHLDWYGMSDGLGAKMTRKKSAESA